MCIFYNRRIMTDTSKHIRIDLYRRDKQLISNERQILVSIPQTKKLYSAVYAIPLKVVRE